jgi:predicted GNAT family N-acyltransferase
MNCIIATKQEHFYDQILIRKEVFIIEQQVPINEEYDELDKTAVQFIVYDRDKAVGAARFRIVNQKGKVERVCVLKDYRKKGVGKLMMDAIEQYVKRQGLTLEKLVLSAQLTALPFYEKLGYIAYGDIYLDANIEHKSMFKSLK